MIKSRWMRRARNVAGMEKMKNTYKILVANIEGSSVRKAKV
jgi:hypothetical protein